MPTRTTSTPSTSSKARSTSWSATSGSASPRVLSSRHQSALRMRNADWCRDERTRGEAEPLVADQEVDLAFEDVEGVDVVLVGMRVRPLEAGVQLELDQSELLSPGLD